jgi:ATP-binding cassette subfamily B protein
MIVVNSAAVNKQIQHSNSASKPLPDDWQAIVSARLMNAETMHGWLEINLDSKLHFKKSLLIITNQRLLHFELSKHNELSKFNADTPNFNYQTDFKLEFRDHAGVGKIELFSQDQRIACWFLTMENNIAAVRFVK